MSDYNYVSEDGNTAHCSNCGAVYNGIYDLRRAEAMTYREWHNMHSEPHCEHFNDNGHEGSEACNMCIVAHVMEE